MTEDRTVAIARPTIPQPPHPAGRPARLALAALACITTTLLATPLLDLLDLANIVMLFLLTVLLVAVRLGRDAAILASVLSVLLFDVFFVPPRFSLAVSNLQYLVTFAVMLVTGLLTAHLAAGLKQRAEEAQQREQRALALYRLASRLAGTLDRIQAAEIVADFAVSQFAASSTCFLSDDHGHSLQPLGPAGAAAELHLARVALSSGQTVRSDSVSGMGFAPYYFPIKAAQRVLGVLAIQVTAERLDLSAEETALFEAVAALLAVALERLHYAAVAHASEVDMQGERLRSSILSALSHDLRTPLTVMVGLADSLTLFRPALPAPALETARALHAHADHLAGLVGNLLEMARLNAGKVTLRLEWQALEEVVGSSIKLLGSALAGHPLQVDLPDELPLLRFDAVLIERVLCNLLENAAKYSPAGSAIRLSAHLGEDAVSVTVSDQGPGLPVEQRADLFRMFVRGISESGVGGSGLGLAICKSIVESHGGTIRGEDAPGGGAAICFTLPRGTPPIIEEESA